MKRISSLLIALFALTLTASAATPMIPYLGSGYLSFGVPGISDLGNITVQHDAVTLPNMDTFMENGWTKMEIYLEPDTVYQFSWTWGAADNATAMLRCENDMRQPVESVDARTWQATWFTLEPGQIGITGSCSYQLDTADPFEAHVILWNIQPIIIATPPPNDIAIQSATSGN